MANNAYVIATNSGTPLIANAGSFPGGSTIGQVEQSEASSGAIFQWIDAAIASGLAATPGNAQVALTWTPAMSATGYDVKRSATSGGPYTTIASVSATSYTDTNVVNGLAYSYVIAAVHSGVEAPNSNEASAMPLVVAYAVNCGGWPPPRLPPTLIIPLPVRCSAPARRLTPAVCSIRRRWPYIRPSATAR